MERHSSIRFKPVEGNKSEIDNGDVNSQFQWGDRSEHPVITRSSVLFSPRTDTQRCDSFSSSSITADEPLKQQESNMLLQNQKLVENPRALLLLLHQRNLEIKGLKSAAQKDPSDRLGCILQELVKSRQKAAQRKSSNEIALRKEVDQLNAELTAVKKKHEQEMQKLEDKLMKSKLDVLQLQKAVRMLSEKSEEEIDTESSTSQDEGTKLACECFELWSEKGQKITAYTSDLRLRRIPKHTSFVDAFNKFGSVSLSEEEKGEIINKLETVAETAQLQSTTEESSQESSRTESQLPSSQSSMAVLTSQKSDFTFSTSETKTTDSSFSLPVSLEKVEQGISTCMAHALEPRSLAQAGLTLGQPSDGERCTHFMPSPFTEKCKWCHSVTSSLRIVSVHRTGKFVRIFNSWLDKEVDLSSYVIQQWVGGYPVSTYRFPNGTILPAQHHITVWAAGANLAHGHPSDNLSGSRFFRADPGCTTILCDQSGQMVSQHTNPHQVTAAAAAYSDNVDLSVDKFPLKEDGEGDEDGDEDDEVEEGPNQLKLLLTKASSSRNRKKDRDSGILTKRRYTRHYSIDASVSSKILNSHSTGVKKRIRDSSASSGSLFFSTANLPPVLVNESRSSSSEADYFALQSRQPECEELETREFKTTLDTTLPMVSLIGQKSARSKYGFKFMTHLPTTTDLHLRRYCPAR